MPEDTTTNEDTTNETEETPAVPSVNIDKELSNLIDRINVYCGQNGSNLMAKMEAEIDAEGTTAARARDLRRAQAQVALITGSAVRGVQEVTETV